MLHRLRLAHRLLLIYLLSLVSVAVLAYSLVAEKNIAIEIANKELRGSAYVAVVRQALLTLIEERRPSASSPSYRQSARRTALQDLASAVEAAERQFGQDMGTVGEAYRLTSLLRQLSEYDEANLEVQRSARAAASRLISRIGDSSNLILDPELDSYYMMSIVMLRLPQLVTTAVDLTDAATALRPGTPQADEWLSTFTLKEGAFAATFAALASDNERTLGGKADDEARRQLEASFARLRSVVADFSVNLKEISSTGQ